MNLRALKTWLEGAPLGAILYKRRANKRSAPARKPIVVAGMFTTASGMGQLATTCAAALERHEAAPVCIDLGQRFGQADHQTSLELSDQLNGPPGTLLLHLNAPETRHALLNLRLWRGTGWHIIGCWAWELEQLPHDWRPPTQHLDEIWACSSFVADAVRRLCDVPVKTVLPMVDIPNTTPDRKRFGLPEKACICLAAADGRSSFERKNLKGSLAMFLAAARGRRDVHLVIKTRNLDLYQAFAAELAKLEAEDARIHVIDGALSTQDHHTLLASTDIILSPHRAEGFGFLVAEGMAHGKPVLATGWSGNMDFMTPGTAIALPYKLVPVSDPFGVYPDLPLGAQWAEPDIDVAAQLLGDLIDYPSRRDELGRAARSHIAKTLGAKSYLNALGWTD